MDSDAARPRRAVVELGATIVYIVFLVAVLLSPLHQRPHPRGQYLNEKSTTADFFINAALFLPLGFGLARSGRRLPLVGMRIVLVVAAATFLFSLAIETLQYLLLPARYSSIVDVAGDTVGAVLGAWWGTSR